MKKNNNISLDPSIVCQGPDLSLAESLKKPMTDLGAAAPPMGERVPQGVVFEETWPIRFLLAQRPRKIASEDIEEHDLWGAVEMNQDLHSKALKHAEARPLA